MIVKIWRELSQILYYRNDLIEIIKPFFGNLKNENINNEKFIPFLKQFPKSRLEVLYQNGIITEKINSIISTSNNEKENQSISTFTVNDNNNTNIEEIISGDQIINLKKLIQERDISTFNTITVSFNDKEMKIPLIQYCIMKKANKCFQYLFATNYDDPNKVMEDQKPDRILNVLAKRYKEIKRYEWDSMATAIYFGNKDIINILKEKIEKGKKSSHIEAAILSYRNYIAKEILDEVTKKEEEIENQLTIALISSAQNNNIKGAELLIRKSAKINTKDNSF